MISTREEVFGKKPRLFFFSRRGGTKRKALGWFNKNGRAHHVSGILKFAGSLPPGAKFVQLVILEVGDVREWVFEWKVPLE